MAFVILAVVALTGCGGASVETQTTPKLVVASFYPLAFAAEELAAPGTRVENATPASTEPHDVELSVRDVERIRGADLVLYLGGGFQPSIEEAVEPLDAPRALDLLDVADPVAADPHVWLDPIRYSAIAERIGRAFGRPAAARRFARSLGDLDRELERGLEDCRRREIVTSHAAFTYLADRYGLEQIAITGLAPEAEPAPQEIEEAVAAVRRSGATTVFFEPLVSPKLAETVAREAGIETRTLDPLEGLPEDRLAAGADYFTVMRENLVALREALGCR